VTSITIIEKIGKMITSLTCCHAKGKPRLDLPTLQ
jgi:hypothetical protein